MKWSRVNQIYGINRVKTEYGEVVLNEKNGAYWHLNDTAARVLSVIEDGGSLEDAAAELVDTYGIEFDQARNDVEAIRSGLERMGAL